MQDPTGIVRDRALLILGGPELPQTSPAQYTIRSMNTGMALDVEHGSREDGAPVVQWCPSTPLRNLSPWQLWQWTNSKRLSACEWESEGFSVHMLGWSRPAAEYILVIAHGRPWDGMIYHGSQGIGCHAGESANILMLGPALRFATESRVQLMTEKADILPGEALNRSFSGLWPRCSCIQCETARRPCNAPKDSA